MLKVITAQEIRNRLGEYLDRAHLSGEGFLITRKDRGKAVLMGATQYLELLDRLESLETGKTVREQPKSRADSQVLNKDQLRKLIG